MFHILGMNIAISMVCGLVSLILADRVFIRQDLHPCAAVGCAVNFFYIASAALMFTLAHAIFKAFTGGVIGGRIKSYLCIGWGLPFLGK